MRPEGFVRESTMAFDRNPRESGKSHTVDGRNPAPLGIYEILEIYINLPQQLVSRISEPSTVVSQVYLLSLCVPNPQEN